MYFIPVLVGSHGFLYNQIFNTYEQYNNWQKLFQPGIETQDLSHTAWGKGDRNDTAQCDHSDKRDHVLSVVGLWHSNNQNDYVIRVFNWVIAHQKLVHSPTFGKRDIINDSYADGHPDYRRVEYMTRFEMNSKCREEIIASILQYYINFTTTMNTKTTGTTHRSTTSSSTTNKPTTSKTTPPPTTSTANKPNTTATTSTTTNIPTMTSTSEIPTTTKINKPMTKATTKRPTTTKKPMTTATTKRPTTDKPTTKTNKPSTTARIIKTTNTATTNKPTSNRPTSIYPTTSATTNKPTTSATTNKPTNKPTSINPTLTATTNKLLMTSKTNKPPTTLQTTTIQPSSIPPKTTTTTQASSTTQLPVKIEHICNRTTTIVALARGKHLTNPNAGLCSDGKHSQSEALLLDACSTPPPVKWRKGPNVVQNCKSIPPFTPVGMFSFGRYSMDDTSFSGIFVECTAKGFKIIIQQCGHGPTAFEIVTTALIPRQNARNYFVVHW